MWRQKQQYESGVSKSKTVKLWAGQINSKLMLPLELSEAKEPDIQVMNVCRFITISDPTGLCVLM